MIDNYMSLNITFRKFNFQLMYVLTLKATSISLKRPRDLYEAAIASYRSLVFF
jgi:hypothetical protein